MVLKNPLKVLILLIIFITFSSTCHSETCLETDEILYNALNLSVEQRKEFHSILKNKKDFSRTERNKYKRIIKLQKRDLKISKHEKDYHKSNPKMTYFGNIQTNNCESK